MVKKGYSLAETLIVIALIMIMAGLFLNSDLPRRKLTIQREAYILSQNIRTMENNAGNARSNTNCNVHNPNSPNPEGGLYPFDGYAIMLDKDAPRQYLIYTNCNEANFFPELGSYVSLSGPSSQEGSFLFNPVKTVGSYNTEKCSPTAQTPCDYYNDNRDGIGYINELIATRKFPSSITIKDEGLRAFIKYNEQWQWKTCDQIIIDYKPTTPVTYIICKIGDERYYGAREGSVTITDGINERIVFFNKVGLVAPKSDTQ